MKNKTTMTKLTPAAQAVLDAFNSVPYYPDENDEGMLAAALRAVADQIAPVENELIDDCWYEKQNLVRDQLLAIADELEGAQ